MLAYIGLGSNLGDRLANLRAAVSELARVGSVRATSLIYETTPVGYTAQPMFLNAVAQVETSLGAPEIVVSLLKIERQIGRERNSAERKGPRLIDLDLLMLDDVVLAAAEVEVPHPRMLERRFVLQPLSEIAPDLIHPIAKRSIAELLGSTRTNESVRQLRERL